MTREIAAKELDGCQYRNEGSNELFKAMKAEGLVAVFGASDDLMEFRGAINDEFGAWDGTCVWVNKSGHVSDIMHEATGEAISALWCEEEGYSWTFKTKIPHSTFDVFEDDEKYCRGIVFSLEDIW